MAFPVTRILDDFNRADEGPPMTGWVTANAPGHKVLSNQMAPHGSGAVSSWNTQYPARQEMFLTYAVVPPTGDGTGLIVRLEDPADFFSDSYAVYTFTQAGAGNDFVQFWKAVAGVSTQLGADVALPSDMVNGDQYGLRAVGNTLSFFQNGSQVDTRTDSEITSAGYLAHYDGGNTARVDDFGGGPFRALPICHPTIPALLAR